MTTTRLVRGGGRRGMRCLLAGSAILLAAAGTAVASTTSAAASQVTAAVSKAPGPPPVVTEKPCVGKKAVGPFTTSGSQVYGKGHTPFVSYGPTIAFTLDAKTWNPATKVKRDMDEKEIKWAATDWCANTVRIQVNQDLFDPTGTLLGIDTSYLNAIKAEVRYAEHFGLVVVLNDSTESSANARNEAGPTDTTLLFWLWMDSIYGRGNGPAHVIFDPFNEPRVASTPTAPTSSQWNTWRNGNGTYYGMQALAGWVHLFAPHNLLWIEGPNYSDSFAGIDPTSGQNYLIRVPNVVYALHHPFAKDGVEDETAWNKDFGYLVGKGIPVVEGEWTNFAPGECWQNAIPQVKNYLAYLGTLGSKYGVGLSAYTLNSGRLLRQQYGIKKGKVVEIAPNPLQPTVITPATSTTVGYSCKASAYSVQAKTAGTEGFGQDAYNFFKAENQQA